MAPGQSFPVNRVKRRPKRKSFTPTEMNVCICVRLSYLRACMWMCVCLCVCTARPASLLLTHASALDSACGIHYQVYLIKDGAQECPVYLICWACGSEGEEARSHYLVLSCPLSRCAVALVRLSDLYTKCILSPLRSVRKVRQPNNKM